MRYVVITIVLMMLAGCTDKRLQSATNLSNVKTQTAAKEYKDAPDAPSKDAIATEYFKTEPQFTQVIDDYAHGRPPSTVLPTEKP